MSNTFVVSDTHFNHKNILEYCNRPFDSIEEMNETLIQNWNETVTNNDLVYHLGDFMMGISLNRPDESFELLKTFVGRLRGKIRLIYGNHDKILLKLCRLKNECPFELIKDKYFLRVSNRRIALQHRPQARDFLLHGHCHGTLGSRGFVRYDVGVDCCNYTPLPLDTAISHLKVLEYKKDYQ